MEATGRSRVTHRKDEMELGLGEWLVEVAEGPDRLAYWRAAMHIGELGAMRATRQLKQVVLESAEPDRRAAALYALWLMGDARATALCLRVAADASASKQERIIAVEALWVSSHRPHVQRELAKYLSDPLPEVRYSALCATSWARAIGAPISPGLRDALEKAKLDTARVYEDGDIARLATQLLDPAQRVAISREGSAEYPGAGG